MDQQHWADLFNAAELPAAVAPDMCLWLRSHVPLCVAFESVPMAGVKRGSGASWREALTLVRGVHASFGLIKNLGHPLYPRSKRLIDRSPASAFAVVL